MRVSTKVAFAFRIEEKENSNPRLKTDAGYMAIVDYGEVLNGNKIVPRSGCKTKEKRGQKERGVTKERKVCGGGTK